MAKLTENNKKLMWAKIKPIYLHLRSKGISHKKAIAVSASIAAESSGDWRATNGTHWGYVQNEKGIVDYVKKYYGGYGHNEQLAFLVDGLLGKLKDTKSTWGRELQKRFAEFNIGIENLISPKEGAILWEKAYERSGGQANANRIAYAEYFNSQLPFEDSSSLEKLYQREILQLPDATRVALPPHLDINKMKDRSSLDNLPLFFDFSNFNQQYTYPEYSALNTKTEFDLPLLATNYKNGGKLVKKHLYGGTLASRYILTYTNPNNPFITYVNLADAEKAGLQYTNDPQDYNSGAWFGPGISEKKEGRTEKGTIFKNNINGQWVNPETTFVAVDPYNRIINNENFDVVLNALDLVPTTGHIYDLNNGWVKLPDTYSGEIFDKDMLDLAEQAARFLSDRGFEHAWRMPPEERIKFARSVLQSDAAGYATVFGALIPHAAASAYNWMTGTNAGRVFTSSMLAGEAIDADSKAITGKSYGDYIADQYGGSSFWWGMTNPGYWMGGNLVKPAVEVLEPTVKGTAASLTSKLVNAAKRIWNPKNKGGYTEIVYNQEPFEQIFGNPSQQIRRNALEQLTKENFPGIIVPYTEEEGEIIKAALKELGIYGVPEDATLLGHIKVDDPYAEVMTNLAKYQIKTNFTPNPIAGREFVPEYVLLDGPLNQIRYSTMDSYIDALSNLPMLVTSESLEDKPAKHVTHITTDALHNHTILLMSGITGGKDYILKSIYPHENIGHGLNYVNPFVKSDLFDGMTMTQVYNVLADVPWNPEVVKILGRKDPILGVEILATVNSFRRRCLENIARQEKISANDFLNLSRTNPEQIDALLGKYIDSLSDSKLVSILKADDSLYSRLMARLLPGPNGLAEQSKIFKYTYRPKRESREQFLYDTLQMMLDKGLTWTKEDADKYMQYLRFVLKKGFVIAAPISAASYLDNK